MDYKTAKQLYDSKRIALIESIQKYGESHNREYRATLNYFFVDTSNYLNALNKSVDGIKDTENENNVIVDAYKRGIGMMDNLQKEISDQGTGVGAESVDDIDTHIRERLSIISDDLKSCASLICSNSRNVHSQDIAADRRSCLSR